MERPAFYVRHRRALESRPAWPDRALERAWEALAGEGGGVAILGGRGRGKTLLAAALTERALAELRVVRAGVDRAWTAEDYAYWPLADLVDAEKRSFHRERGPGERGPMEDAARVPLLVLDEIQAETGSEWSAYRLERLIDHRYGGLLRTILVGNLAARELRERLGSSTASRIQETMLVLECGWPSFRARPGAESVAKSDSPQEGHETA